MKIKKLKKNRVPLSFGNETDQDIMLSHFDPNGSYTGIPTSPDEVPVQDSDDL